ncbi:MAG: RdgB/HAM1 family non-canonical purine NTP pyrophosphatase [Cardiobacteriaceae bacterium]|nr:RdgB/HAM1 family non-canonical purine NTP pyrophosphatase [Cardiobacteriaceae bacterium]
MQGGKIVLASNNAGKLREFSALLADFACEILPQSAFSVPDVEENGKSFIENAIIKARNAAEISGLPAIADDSGLMVEALDGEPGIFSARYAGMHGDDAANNQKLLEKMAGKQNRRAAFVCTIAYLRSPNDPLPLIATGIWQGTIADKLSGANGFGYDPLFIPDEYSQSAKTSAEISKEEKNKISHRALCVKQFLQMLKNNN